MKNELVSVIITVFNGEKYIESSIISALEQTYQHREVIVVDDGSTDASRDIAAKFLEVQYHRKENGGVASARNLGISKSKGNIIAFFDVDDISTPDRLSKQVDALTEANKQIDIVFSQIQHFLDPDIPLPSWLKPEYLKEPCSGIGTSTLAFKRNILSNTGEFNEAYHVGEDIEWLLRARDLGFSDYVVPKVLVNKRVHKNNLSHRRKEILDNSFRLIKDSIDRRNS